MLSKNLPRFAYLIALLAILFSPFGIARAAQASSPSQASGNTIQLTWFYKPPKDGNLQLLASRFSPFVMLNDDLAVRDQLISMGAARPFLQYLRADAIMDPGSCTKQPWRNNAAYNIGDFCKISTEHPDWFMLDKNGQRILNPDGSKVFYMMDPGNPGWRDFFLQRVIESQKDPNWNGVFLDNIEATLSFREQDGHLPANYPDDASYQQAVQGFVQHLYTNYFQPNGKLLYANLVSRRDDANWTNYITYLDGVMHEGWSIDWPNGYRSASTWEKHMKLAEQTQAMGKFIMLISQGTQTNTELQKFAFASYLLVANGQAAFRYANSDVYSEIWMYPNYDLDLGAPLGARYQSGSAWKRDFTNGSVTVDPVNHTASITQGTGGATATPPAPTSVPSATATAPAPTATAPAPTATAQVTKAPPMPGTTPVPPAGAAVYDNTDPGFIYSSGWTKISNSSALKGSYMQNRTVNSSVQFNFSGNSFTVIFTAQIHAGRVSVFVDGVLVDAFDQRATSTKFQRTWKYTGTLENGPHQLMLVFDGPSGKRATIDGLIIESLP